MSWFIRALNITTSYADSYYTSVDPGEFYEWQFQGYIPKGTIFTKRLPETQTLVDGMLIATARINPAFLREEKFGFSTTDDIRTDIMLQAGQIQSPKELVERYERIKSQFNASITNFQNNVATRPYFLSSDTLVKIESSDSPLVHSYGPIQVIWETLKRVQSKLNKDSLQKEGRAHELEYFRRFENAITFAKNSSIPMDKIKLDTLLSISEIKPVNTYKMTWQDCFTKVSKEAELCRHLLDKYESLKWIRTALTL